MTSNQALSRGAPSCRACAVRGDRLHPLAAAGGKGSTYTLDATCHDQLITGCAPYGQRSRTRPASLRKASTMSTTAPGLRHDLPFDPAYGHTLDTLLAIAPPPDEPSDFDDFWTARYRHALAVDIAPALGSASRVGGHLVQPIHYTSTDGVRVGGWLTSPADGRIVRGAVYLHGYGGRAAPEPELLPPGTAAIWPCARGLGTASRLPGVPDNGAGHVLHGIDSAETYIHGGCVADVWCAATTLLRVHPAVARRLAYVGDSFGGGIGAMAVAFDDRFHAVALGVPSFGHHPLRLTLPCTGSGDAVRRHHHQHPEVLRVLRYFDAATAATRVRQRAHVAAARFDPHVPPPGQFAVYNALAGPKTLHVLTAGHFDHPDAVMERSALNAARRDFLQE